MTTDSPKRIHVHLRLPEGLVKGAKRIKQVRGVTFTRVLEEALACAVREHEQREKSLPRPEGA